MMPFGVEELQGVCPCDRVAVVRLTIGDRRVRIGGDGCAARAIARDVLVGGAELATVVETPRCTTPGLAGPVRVRLARWCV